MAKVSVYYETIDSKSTARWILVESEYNEVFLPWTNCFYFNIMDGFEERDLSQLIIDDMTILVESNEIVETRLKEGYLGILIRILHNRVDPIFMRRNIYLRYSDGAKFLINMSDISVISYRLLIT